MIFVIRPLGEGFAPRLRWITQVLAYFSGVVASSTLVGWGAGLLGHAVLRAGSFVPLWLVSALSLVYGLKEAEVLRIPIPQIRWQVPAAWIHRRPIWGSLAYGAVIGLGVFTFIPHPGFYIWLMLALSFAKPGFGATLGLMYGVGRSLSVLLGAVPPKREADDPVANLVQTIMTNSRRWHHLSAVLLTAFGVYLLVR